MILSSMEGLMSVDINLAVEEDADLLLRDLPQIQMLNGQAIDRQAIEQASEIMQETEPVSEIQAVDEVNTTSFQNELRGEEDEQFQQELRN